MPRLARPSTLVLVLSLTLAACGGTQVSTVLSTIGSGPQIVADDLAFDRSEIEVPAGEAVSLAFENREGVPHNVAVYADEGATQPLFVGEIFSGPAIRAYELPALGPGTYHFRCDVHPEMKGRLDATP